MLNLNNPLKLNAKTMASPNLCDEFDADDLKRIGEECWSGYDRDSTSRMTWMKRNEAGMDLALQIQKDKSFPWPGCSNVAFPLVTIAAMQFHARAYPAIVNGTDLVNCAVFGEDPTGQKTARAQRVSTHMSWQLLYEDRCWEEQEDKAILNLSIVGTNFKKTYYSASHGHNVSELVLAKDLVLDYWAKSIDDCPRKTHIIPMFRNQIYEKVMRGTFCDVLEETWYQAIPTPTTTTAQINEDKRQGLTQPQGDDSTPLICLEQHCTMDLDEDGYAEPYIITFESTSKCVLRIVTNFSSEKAVERVLEGPKKGKIIKIRPTAYFTKKTFIPSPDGGIYDIGFGVFLGPLNEAVNSLVNMLLDAGTMQTTGGGFLARGAKIRGGNYGFSPFEWKRVDSTGDDLRKSIYPLPVSAPSDVLFQLLSLLINYTNRVAGTTEMQVGENPGQNTPAETSRTMVEMGQKIYSAIFKRIWRASKEEFAKLYELNAIYVPLDAQLPGGATRDDYQGTSDAIFPVADPNIVSDSMRFTQAQAIAAAATAVPGYNMDEVQKRFLKALRVENIEAVFPGTQGQPPAKDPKLAIAELKMQGEMQLAQMELQAQREQFALELMEERRVNNAKIVELMAKAENESANAQTEQAYAQVAFINTQISLTKSRNEALNTRIEQMLRAVELKSKHRIGMQGLATSQEVA